MSLYDRVYRVLPQSLLVALCLGLGACQINKDDSWSMLPVDREGLDSLHSLKSEFLVRRGGEMHHLDLFIRHDNRTEHDRLRLILSLRRKTDTVYRDTIDLRLSEAPSTWVGQGLLNHEVEYSVPQALLLQEAGIYEASIYAPRDEETKGLTLVGIRLR